MWIKGIFQTKNQTSTCVGFKKKKKGLKEKVWLKTEIEFCK